MNKRKSDGMTVLEMMIATTLFAIVLACIFPFVDQMMGSIQMTRDHYAAATIAQARIERARSTPFSDLVLMTENKTLVDDYGNLAVPDGRFQRTTAVETNTPLAGMTQMTVTTKICCCSRWGWKRHMHPIKTGRYLCSFSTEDGTDEEKMTFLFTEYKN